ncbi:MAG: retron St85 family effector protein [Nibricoccus sp.]
MIMPLPSRITVLRNTFKDSIKQSALFLAAESKIVFICGGADAANQKSERQLVEAYAKKQFPRFAFFRAENVFSCLTASRGQDLLTLEIKMLQYADCVMLITESPGAIAELGAFSVDDEVAKQILLVNDIRYKDEDSFIQKGPVAKIARVSEFKPPIYITKTRVLDQIAEIEERLDRILRKRRSRLIPSDLRSFHKERLLLVADTIAMFSPMRKDELTLFWKDILEDQSLLEFDLAILTALKIIQTDSDYHIRITSGGGFFYSYYRHNIGALRSAILLHYFRKERDRIGVLSKAFA